MLDEGQIIIYNIRSYMNKRNYSRDKFAGMLGYKNVQSLANILHDPSKISWRFLINLSSTTGIPLYEWFTPTEEQFGDAIDDLPQVTFEPRNEFLAQLKAAQESKPVDLHEEAKELPPTDFVKVVFGKECAIHFNGRKLPTSDFSFENINAKYGEMVVNVDVMVDEIVKERSAYATTDKG